MHSRGRCHEENRHDFEDPAFWSAVLAIFEGIRRTKA